MQTYCVNSSHFRKKLYFEWSVQLVLSVYEHAVFVLETIQIIKSFCFLILRKHANRHENGMRIICLNLCIILIIYLANKMTGLCKLK